MDVHTIESLTSQMQALTITQHDFPKKFKQRLVVESVKMKNHFKFIVNLLFEGVLSDKSNKPEAGLKALMVQLAIMIACEEGSDAIGGLMESLKASGNSQVISALEAWVRDDFPTEATAGVSPGDERTEEEPTTFGTIRVVRVKCGTRRIFDR